MPSEFTSVFQKATSQAPAAVPHTSVSDEGAGRDVRKEPSQPSCDSSQAQKPEVPERGGVAGSWDGGLCPPGLGARP